MGTAFLFPGQGSQSAGMGDGLLDRFPELVATADDVLGYPVRELCADGERLRRTEFAQPALYVVNALAYLQERDRLPSPRFLAGHSLGEWSALFAAGCVDFRTGLRLVQRRGELMGRVQGGGMVAVLGVELPRLRELLERAGVDDVDVANHNTPEQLVLAGPRESVRTVADTLAGAGVGKCVPLNVSVAAHSRYLEPAAREFRELLREVRFAEPSVPVIANATGRPHTVPAMPDLLSDHVCRPVRWWDTLCLLATRGVDEVVEVGPGEVLQKMWHGAQPHLPAPAPSAPEVRPAPAPDPGPDPGPDAAMLGSAGFRRAYGTRYAYLAGAMAYGVSGPELLGRLAGAGLFGFLGTAGRGPDEVADDLRSLAGDPAVAGRFGVSLPVELDHPERLPELVELAVRHGVGYAETTGHGGVAAALLCWRFAGARRDAQGRPVPARQLVVKVSRAEQAALFLQPAPAGLVTELHRQGRLTGTEARIARESPVGGDVCVEADATWIGDSGSNPALLPAVLALRDEVAARFRYPDPPRVGAAGGLGTPAALAAAYLAGADFVLTGSVNQCSTQARTSEAAKQLLAGLDLDDTGYAPSGELFELGGRSRVASRGTLFAARAETLYHTYRRCRSLAEIDDRTRRELERQVFHRPLPEVWTQLRSRTGADRPPGLDRAEHDPKRQMALVFRHYIDHATRAAVTGDTGERLNYRLPCSPAMGAFNRYVAGGPLADWRNRGVDAIAGTLLSGAAALLGDRPRSRRADRPDPPTAQE